MHTQMHKHGLQTNMDVIKKKRKKNKKKHVTSCRAAINSVQEETGLGEPHVIVTEDGI
jgi:hypothetical protein